ncbi:hypothetical protein B0H13DRAFT_1923371 [Mycena leptocephala]|nr:hypothetical protein B0H13DRAFT_1923371 [Mycena leptocephala]
MLTLSNLATLLVSFTLAVNAVPVVHDQLAPAVGTVFAVYPGWDMDNGRTTATSDGSELACMQLCSADTTCVAYAYAPYQPSGSLSCFLKNSVDLSTFKTQSVDVSVGLVGACGTSVLTLVCGRAWTDDTFPPTAALCRLGPPPATVSLSRRKCSGRTKIERPGNPLKHTVPVVYPQGNEHIV